jgi:hypothetical protein
VQRADLDLQPARRGAHDVRLHDALDLHLLPADERLRLGQLQRPEAFLLTAQRELEAFAEHRLRGEGAHVDHALHARAELDEHVAAVDAHHAALPDLEGMRAVALGSGVARRVAW